VSKRKARNRSARDHRRARQNAARNNRAAAGHCRLYAQQLPFRGYQQWMAPNADAATSRDDLPGRAAEVLTMIESLAPVYAGGVPLAALWLEGQIRAGVLHLALEGGGVKDVPLPDMATVLADTADHFPDRPDICAHEYDTGRVLHELHAEAGIFLDDDHVICLSLQV
jgi:hypothetical protein